MMLLKRCTQYASKFGSITRNKVSGGDGIPVELFQILKDDTVKVLQAIHQQIWKTQQWPQDWKRSVFIPISKKDTAKEFSNYHTVSLISHASKVMLKILQARLQQYVNRELPDVQAGFRKSRRTGDQIANICWIMEKEESSRKTSVFALLTMPKPLTVWITINCGKFRKRCCKRDLLLVGRLLMLAWIDELPLKWSLPVSSRSPSKLSVSFQAGNRPASAFQVGSPWMAGRRWEAGLPELLSVAWMSELLISSGLCLDPPFCALPGWSCLCRTPVSSLWLPCLSGAPPVWHLDSQGKECLGNAIPGSSPTTLRS